MFKFTLATVQDFCQISYFFSNIYDTFWYIVFKGIPCCSIETFPLIIKWCLFSGGSPFNWDAIRGRIFVPSIARLWRWKIQVYIWWSYQLYLLIYFAFLLQGEYNEDYYYEVSSLIVTFCVMLAPSFMQINLLCKTDEVLVFMNSFLHYYKKNGRKFTNRTSVAMENVQIFAEMLLALSVLLPLIPLSIYILHPPSKLFVLTLIPIEYQSGLISLVFCIGMVFSLWGAGSLALLYIIALLYFYVCNMHFETILKSRRFIKYKKKKKNVSPHEEKFRLYRAWQVLNKIFENSSKTFLTLLYIFIVLCIVSLVIMFRTCDMTGNHYLGPFIHSIPLVLFILQWIGLLHLGGSVSKQSELCVRSWNHSISLKNMLKTVYLKKFQKSCPPISMKFGVLFSINHKNLVFIIYQLSNVVLLATIFNNSTYEV